MSVTGIEAALRLFSAEPIESFACDLLSQSPHAQIWRVQGLGHDWVLRLGLANNEVTRARWRLEATIQQHAAAAGIAPRVVGIDLAGPALLMEYVPGGDFSTRIEDPANDPHLAQSLRILHQLPLAESTAAEAWDWESILQAYLTHPTVARQPLSQDLMALLKPFLATASQREPALVHHDPHAKNWLIQGHALLIDWEYAAPNDPLFDLVAVARYHGWSRTRCEAWLNHYGFTGTWREFANLSLLFDALHWLWCTRYDRFETMPTALKQNVEARLSSAYPHFE